MHSFSSFALRSWLKEDGWYQGEGNSYATLNQSSRALLQFPIPDGLSFSLSAPSATYANSAVLRAYSRVAPPSSFLAGSIGYLSSSIDLDLGSARRTRLKRVVDHFYVPRIPEEPEEKPVILQGGKRIDKRDTLLYGCLHLPSGRIDGLAAQRISQHLLGMISLISILPSSSPRPLSSSQEITPQQKGLTSIVLNLQHTTATWATDLSYSLDDGLFGCRTLYHFGKKSHSSEEVQPERINAEEEVGSGLKGRFSLGGEAFFSARTKSAGLSTGIRFSTLPETGIITQPPTVATLTVNPIMGHISAAYAAQIGRSLALCTQYDFNIHSLLSDLSIGGEWFQRRRKRDRHESNKLDRSGMAPSFWQSVSRAEDDVVSVVKARISTSSEIGLAWESKLANCLLAVGVTARFGQAQSKPITGFGVSVNTSLVSSVPARICLSRRSQCIFLPLFTTVTSAYLLKPTTISSMVSTRCSLLKSSALLSLVGTALVHGCLCLFWVSLEHDLESEDSPLLELTVSIFFQTVSLLGLALGILGSYGILHEKAFWIRIGLLHAIADTVLTTLLILSTTLLLFSLDLREWLCRNLTKGTLINLHHCEDQFIWTFALFLFVSAVILAVRFGSLMAIYSFYRTQMRRQSFGFQSSENSMPPFQDDPKPRRHSRSSSRSHSKRLSFDAFIPPLAAASKERPILILQTTPFVLSSSAVSPIFDSPVSDSEVPKLPSLQRRMTHSYKPSNAPCILIPVSEG